MYQRHDHHTCPPPNPATGKRPPHRCRGHWCASLTTPTGRITRYTTTRRDAITALSQLRRDRDTGTLTQHTITLGQWLTHWLNTTASRRVRRATLTGYRGKTRYLPPHLTRTRLTRITPLMLDRLYADLAAHGYSPRTIAQLHSVIHQALAKAVKQGLIPRNPADLADKPPIPRGTPTVLDPTQARRILDTARGTRMEARWWVALTLGLRQGEALGLGWDDVDLERGTIRVRRALQREKGRGLVMVDPKSRAGYRVIPMLPECVEVMRRHHAQWLSEKAEAGSSWWEHTPDEWRLVFTQRSGRPVDSSPDSAAWHRLLDEAGVPRVRLHDARHTAITLWLLAGVPLHTAKRWAGHSSITLTSDTYGGLVGEMHDEGMRALTGWLDRAAALGVGEDVADEAAQVDSP